MMCRSMDERVSRDLIVCPIVVVSNQGSPARWGEPPCRGEAPTTPIAVCLAPHFRLYSHLGVNVMDRLLQMKCVACRADAPPATDDDLAEWMPQLPEWKIVERDGVRNLERTFKFRNFVQALSFTNLIGELAEAEGHHPDILTRWGKVTVWWSTHKIKNLHRNDFIMAARTDQLDASASGERVA